MASLIRQHGGIAIVVLDCGIGIPYVSLWRQPPLQLAGLCLATLVDFLCGQVAVVVAGGWPVGVPSTVTEICHVALVCHSGCFEGALWYEARSKKLVCPLPSPCCRSVVPHFVKISRREILSD